MATWPIRLPSRLPAGAARHTRTSVEQGQASRPPFVTGRRARPRTLYGTMKAAADATARTDGRRAPAADPPAIAVNGLSKSFDEVEAVRGVDFEVATGEVFGFL